MSDNHNASILAMISFAIGIMVGAGVTLFLAPMSGRELRGRIGEEARADWQWANDQVARNQAEMTRQLESMRQQINDYEHRTREQLNAHLSQLQAKIDKQAPIEAEGDQG